MVRGVSRSAEETEQVGERLGRAACGGEILLLIGELGAGKTCFVRGLARGLGLDPRCVKSPSYDILHQYEGEGCRLALDHFDAYFVRDADEFARTGMDEFVENGHVVAVEWADLFREAFGTDVLEVNLCAEDESSRQFTIEARGPGSSALLERVTW